MKSPPPSLNPRGLTQLALSGLQTAGRPAAGLWDYSVDYTRPPLSPRGTRRRGWGGNDGEPPGLQPPQLSAGLPPVTNFPATRIKAASCPRRGRLSRYAASRRPSPGCQLSRGPSALSPGTRASPVPASPGPGAKLLPKLATASPTKPRRRGPPAGTCAPGAAPNPPTRRGPVRDHDGSHGASAPDTARAPARSPTPGWGLSSPPCPAPPSPLSPDSGRQGPGHAHQRKPRCRTPRRPAPPVAPRAAPRGSGQLSRESCRLVQRKEKGRGEGGGGPWRGSVVWPPPPSLTHSPETRMGGGRERRGGGRNQPVAAHSGSARSY